MIYLLLNEFKKNRNLNLIYILIILLASIYIPCEIVQLLGLLLLIRLQLLLLKTDFLNDSFFLSFYLPVKKDSVILSKLYSGFFLVIIVYFIPELVSSLNLTYIIYNVEIPVKNCISIVSIIIGFLYFFIFYHFALNKNLKQIYTANKIMALILIPIIILFVRYDYLFEIPEAFLSNYLVKHICSLIIIFINLVSSLFYSKSHKKLEF